MKQLLYFLIGFFSIGVFLKSAYALNCYDYQNSGATSFSSIVANNTGFVGDSASQMFTSSAAASSAQTAFRNTFYSLGYTYLSSATVYYDGTNHAGFIYMRYYSYPTTGDWKRIAVYPFSDGVQFTQTLCAAGPADQDSDGIPDDCDIYPDDPTPYKVSVTAFQTDTNTYSGTQTYRRMITDRGQTYELNTSDPEKHLYLVFAPKWEDPPTDCGTFLPEAYTPSEDDTTIEQPPVQQDPSDGTPENNPDEQFQPGVTSDGTKTDNQALNDIVSNTGKTASGIDRLGDYIKEMNRAIQNMARNNISGASGKTDGDKVTEKIDEKASENNTEATNGKDAFESQTDSNVYDGTLVPGTDYQEVADDDLQNESWLSDLINNNPIKEWVDSSGFDYSGGSCEMSFVHPRFGSLSFSLCEFENAFETAGNVLFGLCGLYGLIMIIKG